MASGALWDNEHGLHLTALEAGTGSVTRLQNGGATRFTFKKPFKHIPHVQLTMDRGDNTSAPFKNCFIYLLSNGGPAVDHDGFSVGIFAPVGFNTKFRYMATGISESTTTTTPKRKTPPTKTAPPKKTTTKTLKAPVDDEDEGEDDEEEEEE
ncbi:hypothetical protein N7540_007004 [Penicillium herquei]|nr:hypothetical protein N7540_007004 [Penicillium herquei]